MPAAAVIPAPIAYIKVVAVKKLVVEFHVILGWWSIFNGRTATRWQYGDPGWAALTGYSFFFLRNTALL